MYAYYNMDPDQKDQIRMVAYISEWQELADYIWKYAPHLEEPIAEKFLSILATVGVRP